AGVAKPTLRRLRTSVGIASDTASRRIHLVAPARNFSSKGMRKAKRTSRGSASGTRDSSPCAMLIRSYLTGLFHQDDRMSMAHGLESRGPPAGPRLGGVAFPLPVPAEFRPAPATRSPR